MKKLKKFISSPKATLAVFGVAVTLLLLSTIGGARAALVNYSENHMTEIETQSIGVSLLENGKEVDNGGALLENLTGTDEKGNKKKLEVGREYTEKLSVYNSGQIDQYVRVTIYKYWVEKGADDEGNPVENKVKNVYPGYIELNLADGWVEDPNASTQERTVIYYTGILPKGASVDFADSLRINPAVATIVTKGANGVTYDYEGLEFRVEVNVDAVQTHNAADAILSAWGCKVNEGNAGEDGVLSSLEFVW